MEIRCSTIAFHGRGFLEALFVISCYVLHVQLWYIKSIKSLLRHITISERYSTMGKYIAYLSTNGPCSSIFQANGQKPLRAKPVQFLLVQEGTVAGSFFLKECPLRFHEICRFPQELNIVIQVRGPAKRCLVVCLRFYSRYNTVTW